MTGQVMDTRINEEQREVNAGCFKTYEPEHIHTINKINRQHILSYLRSQSQTTYPSAPRKLFQFPRQTMTPSTSLANNIIFAGWNVLHDLSLLQLS